MSSREIKHAKSICQGCPVRLDCLYTSLEQREAYGVWGMLSSGERRRLMDAAGKDHDRAMSLYLRGRLPSR